MGYQDMRLKELLVAIYRCKSVEYYDPALQAYGLETVLRTIAGQNYAAALRNRVLNEHRVNININSAKIFAEIAHELCQLAEQMSKNSSLAALALVKYYAARSADKSYGNLSIASSQKLLEDVLQMASDEAGGMWPEDRDFLHAMAMTALMKSGLRPWDEDNYVHALCRLEHSHADADRRNWLAIKFASEGRIQDAVEVLRDTTYTFDQWSVPADVARAMDLRSALEAGQNKAK